MQHKKSRNSCLLTNEEIYIVYNPETLTLDQIQVFLVFCLFPKLNLALRRTREKKQFKESLTKVSQISRCATFSLFDPITALLINGLVTVVAKNDFQEKVKETLYSRYEQLSLENKQLINVAIALSSAVLIAGAASLYLTKPLQKGGVALDQLYPKVERIMGEKLNIQVSSELCKKVLTYAVNSKAFGDSYTAPENISRILIHSSLDYINKLIETNQEINFINLAALYEILKICHGNSTD